MTTMAFAGIWSKGGVDNSGEKNLSGMARRRLRTRRRRSVGTSLTMMPFVGATLPSPTAGSSSGLSRSFRRSRSAAAVRRPKAQLG
jgi:hypothetical protein